MYLWPFLIILAFVSSKYVESVRVGSMQDVIFSSSYAIVVPMNETCIECICSMILSDNTIGVSCLQNRTLMTTADSSVTTSSISVNEHIYGVYNTTAGSDSLLATTGVDIGQYPAKEKPLNAIDGIISTKYLSFGVCKESTSPNAECGLNTGFYQELQNGALLVTGFQICTAEDFPERDPLIVTLEGSNLSDTLLMNGSSWNVIYTGDSGLQPDPGRNTYGVIKSINNSISYKNYRFLVTNKRSISNSVQYSEVKLL
ncbi:hypothetical protein I4U23_003635 [Adineta vaga]|nr:hypothetical protein I4U23_003635 [Adineta vaga]